MKYKWFYIAVVLLVGCSPAKKSISDESSSGVLQHILDEECCSEKDDVIGISLSVVSDELEIDFTGSAGYDSAEKTNELNALQPFRIASLTKVFVATTILRLYEKGQLSLEDPISKFISKKHVEILREGGYDPDVITVRHCLNHSSGLYDYAEGGPEYIEEAVKDPNKRWTRTEQIAFAMKHGKPHAPPGEEEHYSDTGYVLLGEIIEKLTGSGLAEGLRGLLKFDELHMPATYLESLEKRPDGLMPNVKRYLEMIDASVWDNSIDLYGGGGLVSNTKDLTVFLQALFNGQIFENGDTLSIMLLKNGYEGSVKDLPSQRLGFYSIVGEKSGIEVYLHSGFWGTVFVHLPAYNCSIAINNTKDGESEALQRTLDYVIELGKKKSR